MPRPASRHGAYRPVFEIVEAEPDHLRKHSDIPSLKYCREDGQLRRRNPATQQRLRAFVEEKGRPNRSRPPRPGAGREASIQRKRPQQANPASKRRMRSCDASVKAEIACPIPAAGRRQAGLPASAADCAARDNQSSRQHGCGVTGQAIPYAWAIPGQPPERRLRDTAIPYAWAIPYGVSSIFPVVSRPSSLRWASRASDRGSSRPT